MKTNRYISFILLFVLSAVSIMAQKKEREYIRRGNRLYKDSLYIKSEVDYRKALDINPKSAIAMFNIGDALSKQNKQKEAMEMFEKAAQIEKSPDRLGDIYHNIGNIFMGKKEYDKAVNAYKQSLMNDPSSNDTRYNLALAMALLKKQNQQNQQNKDKNKDNKDNKDKNKDKDKDKNKDKKDKDKKDQDKNNQNKDNKDNQQNKQQQNGQQPKNEMTKETAEQILQAIMQDEKDMHNKMKKAAPVQPQNNPNHKDW